jgi:hypothetical protein
MAAYVLQPDLFTTRRNTMASTQHHNSLTAAGSPRGASADGHVLQLDQVQERIGDWVAEHPWTMIGVAAGAGVAVGAASRLRAVNELARVAAATASGVAVRLAVNSLAQWFQRERPLG